MMTAWVATCQGGGTAGSPCTRDGWARLALWCSYSISDVGIGEVKRIYYNLHHLHYAKHQYFTMDAWDDDLAPEQLTQTVDISPYLCHDA